MEKQRSILIVGDEGGPRESLQMILKPIYEIHTAANGQQALKCIQNEKIDLVTLDLNMPGLSGLEVLREIKKLKEGIAVIVVTGYGTLKRAQDAFLLGAAGFVFKPFNIAEVIALVKNCIDRRIADQK